MELTMLQNARIDPTVQYSLVIQLSGNIRNRDARLRTHVTDKYKMKSFVKYIE